jgi:hypothetical protein
MDKDAFALLKVVASSLETVKDDIREIKESLKGKVEVKDFEELKDRVKETEKESKALHNKWWFASGIATGFSYIINNLIR